MISDLFLQELKNNNDIEQTISSYVPLKKRGRISNGLCPFHSEKSPSFTVYPENQSFYCFGCGAGGDIITFIRRIENLEYIEAVRLLAQRAGMSMPEDNADDGAARMKARVYEINRALARFYHECLKQPSGKEGLAYLHERGLTNKTITRFGLGYSPNSWDAALKHLKSKGFTEEELLTAAVVSKSGKTGNCFDQFRSRVMFPIIDLRGNVIGFGGRSMGDNKGPKYLNSSDTPVFKKSRNLFALNFAKASKREGLLLCEGYMDVIAVQQAGFDNAVATLGTALTAEQARLAAQYTSSVTIAYDSDGPGQAATRRAVGLFSETGVKVRVLTMSGAKDPDEYIKKFGAERFGLLIDGASNATEYAISKLRQKYDLETADGKVAFLKEFVALMRAVPNAVERDVYLAKIAAELEVDKGAITTQLTYEIKRAAKKQKRDTADLKIYSEVKVPAQRQDIQRARNIKYALAEDKLLAILMKNPDYYERIAEQISLDDFVTDRNRAIAEILFDRLQNGQSIELNLLSSQMTVEQMGVVAELVNSISGMMFHIDDVDSYISAILSKKNVKSQDEVATMSDDDLKAYIASLALKKK
ncbi:DNA primase [Oscillospiraceae bacterium PP1C4]